MFAGLAPNVFKTTSLKSTRLDFEDGEALPFRTEKGAGFYCVQGGHVKVILSCSGRANTVFICGPGDIVGYGEWFEFGSSTAVAIGDVKACYFPENEFTRFQEAVPPAAHAIIKKLCHAIRFRDDEIAGLENYSLKSRVAALLTHLHDRFGVEDSGGIKIDVKIDRKTLAQLSGTVIESFARVLTELEQDRIVERRGRSIVVLDSARLRKI